MPIAFNHMQRWDADRINFPGLDVLTQADYERAVRVLKGPRKADLILAPDGTPYLFRWYIYPQNELGFNLYFHVQVASDPERPLHDHPWDNASTILAGGYEEHLAYPKGNGLDQPSENIRHPGDMISRPAILAHRLVLPAGIPYSMTMFMTGPKIREWGFWYPDGWVHHAAVVRIQGDLSVHVERQVM